ncbi:hypothetical protein [Spongiivirga citrea]|uniref:Uncharacterized protein n=1 Tax=Spongiivirga citrea TaxID=1481457 RepID=A0A6M0CHT2_9FLAO|nr:hypothetical protein [Spongiivirga citrea]NER17508.1 hypothetical protein [Spongiivirga citrea]
MLLKKTNIENALSRARKRDLKDVDILSQVYAVLEKEASKEERIEKAIKGAPSMPYNNFDFELLDSNRIYHIAQIKKICIDYRLRFLDSKYFKSKIPQRAISEIKALEKSHNIEIDSFKIIAPSKLFKLEKADDPLLFTPIGNGYFYLIHKWGNDLHPLRKLLMMPFKSFPNLMFVMILVSYLLTSIIPTGIFSKNGASNTEFLMLFLFMLKSVVGVVLFYGFALGKSFNTLIWNSKYDRANF